ncbi:hypothetical protein PSPO01_03690 [Paraphaeosphaeria sporulosa]
MVCQLHLFSVYRDALSAKYGPTEFGILGAEQHYRPDSEAEKLQAELVASRSEWKKLGAGFEGTTYVLNDTVIKTFTPGRSPFRNCHPKHTTLRWPTEIPASLLFCSGSSGRNATSRVSRNAPTIGCLPVKAAFHTAAGPGMITQWHLVMPLARQGTLKSLSKNVQTQNLGFRILDARYRATFHELLRSLQILHETGFCHDDIKPDNIFVGEKQRWILGDLGNVRHVSHPYHKSRIWSDNMQLPDCRTNDAVRALKSYISFLRASSINVEALDEELFLGREPLSKLFLWMLDDATTMTAEELRERSSFKHPAQTVQVEAVHAVSSRPAWPSLLPYLSFRGQRLSRRVKHALNLSNSEMLARWKAMTWIFGIDQSVCSGM